MFTLKIATDNAAFADGNGPAELARILRAVADRLESDLYNRTEAVRDGNGNKVGSFEVRGLNVD